MKEMMRHRVVTFLDREELDFLDNISKDILFSKGVKVARATILRTIVDAYLAPRSKSCSYEDLKELIIDAVYKKKNDA